MSERPNFILITTDQQRFDTIHAAGNESIWTPHLNWLCDTGIRYANAYSDCPVCAPARSTIMTGQHAWNHGQINNGGQSPMANLPTLPGLLTQAGYQTRAVGKMHFSPTRAHYGFEHMELLPDYYRQMARQPGVAPPKNHGIGENEMEPVFSTTDDAHTLTQWTVDRSIDFLETRDETRPFFLWTSFSKPHPPFDPPKKFWDLYDGIEMPDPVYGDWSQTADDVPAGFRAPTWHLNNIHRFSPQKLRAMRRAYYACISHIDYTLGLLFARLREMNLLENTWIIFTSDHGEMLGDHWLGAKSVFFEGSAHVPLLVRPPANGWKADNNGGSVDNRLACLADLLPTFLHLAGIEAPENDGLNLLGEHEREYIIGQSGDFHSVITSDWKFHFCERGGDQLFFNIRNDAMEEKNLIGDAKVKNQLQFTRDVLINSLSGRSHPAVQNDELIATGPAPEEIETRRRIWPGFHSRGDENCDLLH